MPIAITVQKASFPLVAYVYKITGLVNGANVITLPAPPLPGSFPPAADWTPTFIYCFPFNTGAVGSLVTPDLSTIANSAGTVSFTLNASGATSVYILVA